MRRAIALLLLGLLTACSGRIYTIADPKPDAQGRIEGVIVYQPKPLVLVIVSTQAQDKDGKVIGSSDDKSCEPVMSFEIVNIPDYARQYAVRYDAALFESNKFSLELDKGVITKINSESTSAAKEALDVFQGILGTLKEITAKKAVTPIKEGVLACNAGKKIIGQMDIADIPRTKPNSPNN